jgi:hypothetical protein
MIIDVQRCIMMIMRQLHHYPLPANDHDAGGPIYSAFYDIGVGPASEHELLWYVKRDSAGYSDLRDNKHSIPWNGSSNLFLMTVICLSMIGKKLFSIKYSIVTLLLKND